jgi:hypothetical protein
MDDYERQSRLAARSQREIDIKLAKLRVSLSNAHVALRHAVSHPSEESSADTVVWARARIHSLNGKVAILEKEIERRITATQDVIGELGRDYPGGRRGPVHEHLCLESLVLFTKDAKAWLGDRSELSMDTLESADYSEALGYAREMSDWRVK